MEKQLPAWVLGALGLLGSVATAQSGLMATEVESLDGNQRDMTVSHADVTSLVAAEERILLSQGRRLAEHLVSTRARQFVGELTFPTDLAAVEVDEARKLMFVLTNNTNTGTGTIEGELRVYDILDPSAPSQLGQALQVTATDIRVIPEDQKLLLIQTQKVIVYDYQGATSLTQICESETLTTAALSVTCGTEPTRAVSTIGRAVVQVDGAIRRVFLRCGIKHNRVPEEVFKGASGIVALDLTGYPATPTFYDHIFDAYPCPAPADPFLNPPSKWAVRDLAITTQGSNTFLCTVGSEEYQLKVFRITNFPVDGFDHYTEKDFDLGPGNDLQSVDVVATSPVKLLILSRQYSIGVEFANANNFVTVSTPFGDGPFRDTVLLTETFAIVEPFPFQ